MYRLINKKKKGFTLVEILVSVVIIGILATALIPKVSTETNKAKEAGIDTDFRSFYTGIKAITTLNGVEEYNTKEKLEVLLNKNLEPQLRFSNGLSAQKDPWEKPYELYSETLEDENTYIVIASKGNDKRDGFIFEPERTDNNLRRVAKVCDDHKYFLAIGMTTSGKTVGKITNEQIFKVVHEGEEWTGTNDNGGTTGGTTGDGGTTGGTTGDGGTTEGLVIEQIENLIANLESLDGVSEIQNMINEIKDETEQIRLQGLLDTKIEGLGTDPGGSGTSPEWMDPEYLATLPPIVAGATAVQNSVGTNGEYVPTGYVLASDSDFSGEEDGDFRYIGSNKYIAIPHVIKGVNVTSYYEMFKGTSVEGVASNNSNVTMSSMFSYSAATQLDLSNLDTSNVTYMNSMFQDSAATQLDLSSFNTSNVINMQSMFSDSAATSLDLSSFNTSNVTDMNNMFGDSAATSLDLSSFNTSNVTDMNNMFGGSAATSLDLSSFNTSNVTDMNNMFGGSAATSLDLSTFDTSNVTNMGYMFYESAATSLNLSSFNTSNVTDMGFMFYNSTATSLNLSTFDTSNVTNMDGMFCGSAATIGYARTQTDADKFNNSGYKPEGLTFIVKP